MKLTFSASHLSITAFQEIEVPDFTVLTGVNGSGKSHLLDAIELRKVQINNSASLRIVKFNFETFRLENEGAFNAYQIAQERSAAWNFYETQVKPNAQSWKGLLGDEYKNIVEHCAADKKPLWEAGTFGQLTPYKNNVKEYFNNPNIKNNQASVGLYSLIKKLPFSVDELQQDAFNSLYKPYMTKQDFLPQALGRIIWDYYVKLRTNQVNDFENTVHGKNYKVLSEQEFVEAHGLKPWEVLNEILATFQSLEYKVNSPEGTDFFGDYVLRLVHTSKENLQIDFSSLSSGERVLMALVASIYKSSSDNHFPDVLLLDELDASLHPSMMKNMLAVIQDIFLARDVKVILVTHSPTTIALSPEESVYVMNKSGIQRIQKRSRSEALAILTEGFATLESGLMLFDQVSKKRVSILTEGRNISYLERMLSLFGLSDDVGIIKGAESITGKSQLKTLFDFFTKVIHVNRVVFVWDCDVTYCLQEENNTFPFVFQKNSSNALATTGIENLFPEHFFSSFKKTVELFDGKKIIEFDASSKVAFEKHVLATASSADFEKFAPLVDKLRALVAAPIVAAAA